MLNATFLLVQLIPHALLTAVGFGLFGRFRSLATALATGGFLVAAISDIVSQFASDGASYARWVGLAGVWVGALGLLWHVLGTRKRNVP